MMTPILLRMMSMSVMIGLSSLGTGFGQGLVGFGELRGLGRQILGHEGSFRAMMLGLALTETSVLLTFVLALLVIFSPVPLSIGSGLAEVGIALAMGVSSLVVAFASSMVVHMSCIAIARQPFFSARIITFMLLIQSIIEAPVIFSFIVALIIKTTATTDLFISQGIRFLSAGMVIGVGSVGSSIGQAIFGYAACKAIGKNRAGFSRVFPFSLLSAAVIETSMIFAALLALLLLFRPFLVQAPILFALTSLISAFVMSVGSIGTGIATGNLAARACRRIGEDPETYPFVVRMTLVSQAIIESAAIYALIVALVVIMRA